MSGAVERYGRIADRLMDVMDSAPIGHHGALLEAADAIRYLAVRLDAAEAELQRWAKGKVPAWTVRD